MVEAMEELGTEKQIVLYNVLKKVINTSYSVLPTVAIASFDVGITNESCLLLRLKDRELFLINPQFIFCGSSLTFLADNLTHSLEGKEKDSVLEYLYKTRYLEKFPKVYI